MATILITGAGGFIGQELAAALAADPSIARIVLTDIKEPPIPEVSKCKEKFKQITIDLTGDTAREELFQLVGADLDTVYLLHGIMSGAAEANLELGYAINLNATIDVLQKVRGNPATKVIYASVSVKAQRNMLLSWSIPLSQRFWTSTVQSSASMRGAFVNLAGKYLYYIAYRLVLPMGHPDHQMR
jgi:nucleoside-diphosphate-sugar epimerase